MTLSLIQPIDETGHFTQHWRQQLACAFKSIEELCGYLRISPGDLPVSAQAARRFPIKVPLNFAASMAKKDPFDPLLRQVLPVRGELADYAGYSADPVGDLAAEAVPGVLHKYRGRALLINTGACAIHCRYCFRRNFPYADHQLNHSQEALALDYLRNDATLKEVILSGGDPLLLSDARLAAFLQKLDAIGHLQRLRIHTRLPIVLPARVTENLLKLLSGVGKHVVLVVHCNHANEINPRVGSALDTLRKAGIMLFNQSVLLRGVNDSAAVLCSLSEALFAHGVVPYYLHLLDKAAGTGHFEVPEAHARGLMKDVQTALPGYLVPKLVRDRPQALAKEYGLPAV